MAESMDRSCKLLGKVALITGAGGGIGGETARLFARLGATVSLLDIDEKTVRSVASDCQKLSVHGQPHPFVMVGSVAEASVRKKYVEDTVKHLSKIDILVNNAGVTKTTFLLNSPMEDFDAIFDVNVRSIVHLTQLAAPYLIKTKGSVVNLASAAAHRVVEGRIFYGMSKACVKHFTQYAAEELAQHQVRVNSISPGVVKTEIFLNYQVSKEELPKYFIQAGANTALARCAEPAEVAEVLAFLVSQEASFVTGADLLVDGGLCIKPMVKAKVTP